MNRIIQEAGPNQDWLDWLYVSSRVFIFISVLYFYSSPGRFIVVAGFALLFYLYVTFMCFTILNVYHQTTIVWQKAISQFTHIERCRLCTNF